MERERDIDVRVVEAQAREITDEFFGAGVDVQMVDVPAPLQRNEIHPQGMPKAWSRVDPRTPVTAAMIPEILALYESWLPRNIKSRGRRPSPSTMQMYLREARIFVEWLVEQELPEPPDFIPGPAILRTLWHELDARRPVGIPLLLLTPQIIDEYVEHLLAPGHGGRPCASRNPRSDDGSYSPATLKKKATGVGKFTTFCEAQYWLADDPVTDEITNRIPKDNRSKAEKIKALTPEQARALVLTIKDEVRGARGNPERQARAIRDYAIITLMMGQGLRINEVRLLDVSDYNADDTSHGAIVVWGKGSKERTVALSETVQAILKLWLNTRRLYTDDVDGALFVNIGRVCSMGEVGDRLSTRRLREIVDGYLRECGLKREGVSAHSLRHTFATNVVYEAQGALGKTPTWWASARCWGTPTRKRPRCTWIRWIWICGIRPSGWRGILGLPELRVGRGMYKKRGKVTAGNGYTRMWGTGRGSDGTLTGFEAPTRYWLPARQAKENLPGLCGWSGAHQPIGGPASLGLCQPGAARSGVRLPGPVLAGPEPGR